MTDNFKLKEAKLDSYGGVMRPCEERLETKNRYIHLLEDEIEKGYKEKFLVVRKDYLQMEAENAKLKNNLEAMKIADGTFKETMKKLEEKDSIISNLRSDIRTEQDGQDELNETNRVMMNHITDLKAENRSIPSHIAKIREYRDRLLKVESENEKLKGEVNQMQRHWDEEQDCRGQVEHQLELCEAENIKLNTKLISISSKLVVAKKEVRKECIEAFELDYDDGDTLYFCIDKEDLDCLTEATNFSRGFAEGTEVKSRKEKKK